CFSTRHLKLDTRYSTRLLPTPHTPHPTPLPSLSGFCRGAVASCKVDVAFVNQRQLCFGIERIDGASPMPGTSLKWFRRQPMNERGDIMKRTRIMAALEMTSRAPVR